MTSIHAHRDSDISVSRFNRWVVAERARSLGDDGRTELDGGADAAVEGEESHRQYGASLAAASRAQIQRDRQECDAMRQTNLMRGLSVRDDVLSQKEEAQRLKAEWVEYGRKLAEKDAEQRRKIREVCGEGSRRVQDMVAQTQSSRRSSTSLSSRSAVPSCWRRTARRWRGFGRRPRTPSSMRRSSLRWTGARSRQRRQRRRRRNGRRSRRRTRPTISNRRGRTARRLRATRAHTKKLREEIVKKRQKEAERQREASRKNKLLKDQQLLESGQGVKAVHDNIYRSKYVPQDSAELLNQSPNAKYQLQQGNNSGAFSPTKSAISERSGERESPDPVSVS